MRFSAPSRSSDSPLPPSTRQNLGAQGARAFRPPTAQGRDGSPQPTQASGAKRRPAWRLRLKNRASRRSAPTIGHLPISALPFAFIRVILGLSFPFPPFAFRVASFAPAHVALRAAFGRRCWFAPSRDVSPFGLLMQPTAQPPCCLVPSQRPLACVQPSGFRFRPAPHEIPRR